MLVVALALLPIAALVLYNAAMQRREGAANAKADAMRLARLCASDHERILEGARQLLVTLAQTPAVQHAETAAASELFASIIGRFKFYANVGLLDGDGNVVASGVNAERPLNLANRAYFQRAVTSRDFSIGDFQIGRITHTASLNVAFPLLGADGAVQSVIYAAIDLSWLNQIAARIELPPAATMTVSDQNGVVLARVPNGEAWVGRSTTETPIGRGMAKSPLEGTSETAGADGVARLYAFTSLQMDHAHDHHVFVSIGIPRELAFRDAQRALDRQLWMLAVFALVAFAAAWFLADALVLRRVRLLVAATRKIAAGDLTARADGDPQSDELGQLAHAFDEMADSLDHRVAERNETQSALVRSETLFRTLFEFSPVAIFVEDENGRVLDVNAAACRLHLLTREELLGKHVTELVPHAMRETVERTFPMWLNGDLGVLEGESITRHGRAIPVEVRGTRIDYGGRPAVLLHVTDIAGRREAGQALRLARETLEKRVEERTAELAAINAKLQEEIADRKRAEEALHESAERFELVMRATNDGIWDWNLANHQVYFSRRWKTMLGYEYDEIENDISEWETRLHPDDVARASAALKAYFENATPIYELEHRLRHKDGKYRWILARGIALRDEHGKVQRLAGSHIDLTERREAEEEMRELHHFLDSIVENIPNMIFVKDALELRFVRLNKAGEDLLGVKRDEMIGKNDYDLFPKNEADFFTAKDRSVLESGALLDLEEEEIETRAQGLRFLHTKKIPILDSAGQPKYLLGISEDITARKRAQENLARTAAELKRSNEELEQFAYVASHDLQEPLRMVASYTQLLQRRYAAQLDATANEFIDFAVDGARRMQHFIADLLQYSRVATQARPLASVELAAVLETVRVNLKIALEESRAQLTSDPLPAVQGDPRQLTQLLQNLIGNALKFRRPGEPPAVRVTAERVEHRQWRIGVADNGIGIAPEFFERVFVIFQRLHGHDEYPGTGIGLAISKKIVERHGGRIWVESEPGQGTTFFFTLAAAEVAA